MSNNYIFKLNDYEFTIQVNLKLAKKLGETISDELLNSGKYFIQSQVSQETFQHFLDFLNEKIEYPEIDVSNYYDYFLLSGEFNNILSSYLEKSKFDQIKPLSILLKATTKQISDKSNSEEDIAQHLDYFLENHEQEMEKIPYNSLYNIFRNKKRILDNQERAYQFIKKIISKSENNNNKNGAEKFCILLQTLDSSQISEESFKESLAKKDENFGFAPKLNFSFVTSFNETVSELKIQMSELMKNQMQMMIEMKSLFDQKLNFFIEKSEETKKEVQNLSKSNDEIKDKVQQIINENDENKKVMRDLINNVKSVETDVKKVPTKSEIDNLSEKFEKIEKEVNKITKSNEEAKDKVQQIINENIENKKEMRDLINNVKSVETDVKKVFTKIEAENLSEKFEKIEKEVNKIAKSNEEAKGKIQQIINENAENKKEMKDLIDNVKSVETDVKKVLTKSDDMQNKINENFEKIKGLQNSTSEISKKCDDTQNYVKQIPNKFDDIEKQTKQIFNAVRESICISLASNGSSRGIIHDLTEECGGNVSDKGIVNVTSSSCWPNQYAKFAVDLDDVQSYFESDYGPGQWLKYDFKDRKVSPFCYLIRSSPFNKGSVHLMNWVIEGSNSDDSYSWTVLDSRNNITSLDDKSAVQVFSIQKTGGFYRYLRIRQTGKNSSNRDDLGLSALEYFGSIQ